VQNHVRDDDFSQHNFLSLSSIQNFSFRIQTSYVAVEPKRKRQQEFASSATASPTPAAAAAPSKGRHHQHQSSSAASSAVRELRRARIVITVKRTESYKRWLEENPLQAVIAGDGDDDVVGAAAEEEDDAAAAVD
jgi:hypothetical protein